MEWNTAILTKTYGYIKVAILRTFEFERTSVGFYYKGLIIDKGFFQNSLCYGIVFSQTKVILQFFISRNFILRVK